MSDPSVAMVFRLCTFLGLATLAAVLVVPASAQSDASASDDALDAAEDAFFQGQFADATTTLERLIDTDPDNAEAHYLLARVYYAEDNPERSASRAGRAVERAIRRDPENVVYRVALLEQLRADSWNLIDEIIKLQRRRILANRILELDSTNAFAHQELGEQAIRDYYQYRNAVAVIGVSFTSASPFVETSNVIGDGDDTDVENDIGSDGGLEESRRGALTDITTNTEEVAFARGNNLAPREIPMSDRFNVEALLSRGIGAAGYKERADNAREKAMYHLEKAIQRDARRRSVYDHVLRLAALSQDWASTLPALREMNVQYPNDPQMWLYTGLVQHRLGNYEPADAAFTRALERMDSETREAFNDLTLILPPEEWNDFRTDPETFARRYWTSRDPRFLNTVNERKTEHYARLTTAELLYRSDDLDIPGWKTQRGRLHVRYGVPENDVVIEGGYQAAIELFADRDQAYRPSLAEIAANRFNVWDYGDLQFVFEDPFRSGEYRLYSPPADLFSMDRVGAEMDRLDYVQLTETAIREVPERFTFVSPGRGVPLPYLVTAFKGEGGQTDLYVNYGIPISAQAPDGEDVDVTVNTGAFLIGSDRDLLVERRRTIYGLRSAQIVPFEETRLWTSTEAITSPPGPNEVSLEFETAGGGTSGVQRRQLDVPDFRGDGLQLSDILLAYYVEDAGDQDPGRVVRSDLSIQPAPWGVFGNDDPIYIYFETYGLTLEDSRSDYEVEARLVPKDTSRGLRRLARRIFGGGRGGVSSAYPYQSDLVDEGQYVILDVANQNPGLYTLTVKVRDLHSGRSVERETDLFLE
ncbi:MAG: GWxTD domain-containing protein [Bacteroidota bacterium]